MKLNNLLFLIAVIFTMTMFGCSSSGKSFTQPGAPSATQSYSGFPVAVSDLSSDGNIIGGMGVLGLFQVQINPSQQSGELISLRQNSLEDVLEVVDITNFLQLAPCVDCVKIQSI